MAVNLAFLIGAHLCPSGLSRRVKIIPLSSGFSGNQRFGNRAFCRPLPPVAFQITPADLDISLVFISQIINISIFIMPACAHPSLAVKAVPDISQLFPVILFRLAAGSQIVPAFRHLRGTILIDPCFLFHGSCFIYMPGSLDPGVCCNLTVFIQIIGFAVPFFPLLRNDTAGLIHIALCSVHHLPALFCSQRSKGKGSCQKKARCCS